MEKQTFRRNAQEYFYSKIALPIKKVLSPNKGKNTESIGTISQQPLSNYALADPYSSNQKPIVVLPQSTPYLTQVVPYPPKP